MKNTKSKRAGGLVFALVALAISGFGTGLAGCSNEHPAQTAKPEFLSGVEVTLAQTAAVPDWLEAVGTVRAAQASTIASQVMGNIIEIRAHEGDRVQAGQVLAVIDDTQPRAAVQQATAGLLAAEKEASAAASDFTLTAATLKRYQQLYDKKSVSPQEFDEIKARYESAAARRDMTRAGQAEANAALAQAQTLLSYTRIRAPFAGLITEKKTDVGTLASPGLPIFTVEDTRRYRLEATVDESDIRLVRMGQPASVLLDVFGDADLRGRVVQIVPAADPASRGFTVKIELPADARLRSGLFGRARFARGERSALFIPRAAPVERGQLQAVYVVDAKGMASLRYVTLGATTGDRVEVLSGLQAGEKIVAAPRERELGGKQVAVSQ
jgi:RND family efflux transporter MFP subunit